MAIQIKSGKDIVAGKGHMLIVGKPKRGKTRLIGTASRHEKLFVIDLENGLSTIAGGDFDYVQCNTYDEYIEALNWFVVNAKEHMYTAVAIDSMTRVQHLFIDKIMKGKTDKKMGFDAYAEMLATLRKQLDILTKATDFVTIMTVHEEDKQDDGNMCSYPLLDGAIKFEIAGYFNTVIVSECGKDKEGKMQYWCKLTGSKGTVAGSRLKHLRGIDTIPNDYVHLINKENDNVK